MTGYRKVAILSRGSFCASNRSRAFAVIGGQTINEQQTTSDQQSTEDNQRIHRRRKNIADAVKMRFIDLCLTELSGRKHYGHRLKHNVKSPTDGDVMGLSNRKTK